MLELDHPLVCNQWTVALHNIVVTLMDPGLCLTVQSRAARLLPVHSAGGSAGKEGRLFSQCRFKVSHVRLWRLGISSESCHWSLPRTPSLLTQKDCIAGEWCTLQGAHGCYRHDTASVPVVTAYCRHWRCFAVPFVTPVQRVHSYHFSEGIWIVPN